MTTNRARAPHWKLRRSRKFQRVGGWKWQDIWKNSFVKKLFAFFEIHHNSWIKWNWKIPSSSLHLHIIRHSSLIDRDLQLSLSRFDGVNCRNHIELRVIIKLMGLVSGLLDPPHFLHSLSHRSISRMSYCFLNTLNNLFGSRGSFHPSGGFHRGVVHCERLRRRIYKNGPG